MSRPWCLGLTVEVMHLQHAPAALPCLIPLSSLQKSTNRMSPGLSEAPRGRDKQLMNARASGNIQILRLYLDCFRMLAVALDHP